MLSKNPTKNKKKIYFTIQVWYQNSRARERKGQFRQNIQIINKKCPHCAAIFKIKSALEWHLQSKHGDKQAINVDQIPDLKFTDGLLNLSSAATPFETKNDEIEQQQQQQKQQPKQHDQNSPTTTPPPTAIVSCGRAISSSMPASSASSSVSAAASILALVKGRGSPLDLSKAPPSSLIHQTNSSKYEQSESEISFSDSNNDHDESNDFFTNSSSLNNGSLTNRPTNTNGNNQRTFDGNLLETTNNGVVVGCGFNDYNITTNGNVSSDYFGNDRDNTNSPFSQTSSNHSVQQKKRFRTQMSNLQVRILKTLFRDVKTPSMTDCSNIGREIGLQKRVIQVWFQNARAKEKKFRNQRFLHDENTFENDTSTKSNVDSTTSTITAELRDCSICHLQSVNIQEHAFSAQHIAQVRMLLESNSSKNDDQQHIDNSTEHEFNGIYSQLCALQQNKTNNTDITEQQSNTSIHDEDDTDVDNHFSNITDIDGNIEPNDDEDDNTANKQNEDVALNEANKAALALRNFNKLQQHFAAATALAKQQQHHQQHQQQHQTQCDNLSSVSPPTMENNLMLKINTDNPLTSNHSEMLQQLFNYSQMSVIGGK